MQAASEHIVPGSADNPIVGLGSIVADMMSLIGHVQASIALIEAAIGSDPSAAMMTIPPMSWCSTTSPPAMRGRPRP